MILYDKKYCTIELDVARQRLIQHWRGFTTFEQFKEADDVSLQAFKTYRLRALLADIKEQGIVSEKEKDYAAYIMNECIKHGLKEMVFVLPRSLVARITVDEFKALFPPDLIVYRQELAAAHQWLDQRLQHNKAA